MDERPADSRSGAWMRGAVAVAVALALLVAPLRAADAEPREEARAHYQKGKAAFDGGDFRTAIAEFSAADRLAPSPLLHFNIGLCHEQLGDPAEALRRYRLYVGAMPDAPNRAAVDEKIRRLSETLAAQDDPTRADRPIEPPLDGPAPAGPTAAAPSQPSGAPTGDPELDQVAAVDVGAIREQRRQRGAVAPPAVAAPPATAAAPPTGPSAPPAGAASPAVPSAEAAEKPVYKQWWFWVVAGVATLILIDYVSSDPDEPSDRARFLPPIGSPGSSPTAAPGGATLFRF